MFKYVAIVTLLLALSMSAVAEEDDAFYTEDPNVEELNDKTFDEWITNNNGFVEFYAPWCGHCKSLKPIYKEAAAKAPEGVGFAALDANKGEHGEFASKYGVQGFPTIKFFRNGVAVDYDGDRSADAFLAFAAKMNKPSFTKVDTAQALADFDETEGVKVYGYFEDADSEHAKAFTKLADTRFTKQAFALVTQADLVKGKANQVRIAKEGEDDEVYDMAAGDKNELDLEAWAKANSYPVVDVLDQASFGERVANSDIGNFILFVDPSDDNTEVKDTLRGVAKKYKGKTQFFTIDGVEYGQFAKNLGLDNTLPSLAVLTPASQNHYLYKGEKIDTEGVTQFVEDQLADKLVRTYKSEEVPAEQTGPVRVVVGKAFNEEVLDNDKDVLVMYYAPWCGHCRKLKPIYAKVAKYLAPIDSLVIAKFDADANEVNPKWGNVQGFPTLLLYKKGEKQTPVSYDGARTFKALVKWLKKNVATEFELPKVEGASAAASDDGKNKDEL